MKPLTKRGAARLALPACLLLVLAACSSGKGGPGSEFGDGQQTDPATVDFPIAYVKRTLPVPPDTLEDDARVMRTFNVDADLFFRNRASPSATEVNITRRVTGDTDQWDIKDVESSYDGKKLIFAMRGPMIENADEEDQPTWNIWEYNRDTDALLRIITSDITAEEGHDVAPHYLPDGRIVFSSTRQRQSKAILLDESKPQFEAQDEDRNEPAFVLHVMNADGSGIHQISFNQSHDMDPTVLDNGRILYSRWDHAPGNNGISLFTMNPDGSDVQLLYGFNSHNTGANANTPVQFLQPRVLENGRILTLLRPFAGTELAADIISIDTNNYVENTQPTLPNAGVLSGPAQVRAVTNDIRITNPPTPSPGGTFSGAYPLRDGSNRMFVSWSLCRILENGSIVPCTDARLADPNAEPAPPAFGVWIYDFTTNTQLPVVAPQEGLMITDMVSMKPLPLPAVILDKVAGVDADANLVNENVGVLHIRSVYDIDGVDTSPGGLAAVSNPNNAGYAARPARFLRIEKAVSMPDRDVRDFRNTAFGATGFMREILGYAPIEPDGSVRVKVPANVAFAISVVDADGRRLPGVIGSRHNSWLQLRPGEVKQCNGCHNPNSTNPQRLSHGRDNLFAAANAGATTNGAFPGTNPAIGLVNIGDTMATARARTMCPSTACPLSVDIIGNDVWPTTPPAAFDFCYSTGATDVATDPTNPTGSGAPRHNCATALTTLAPAPASCERLWTAGCRITINYEQHIQPLWTKARPVVDVMGTVIGDNTCTNGGCHAPRDAMGQVAVPAGQLDLAALPSNEVQDRFVSYQELLFSDNEQEVIMGALQDRLVPGPPDANGNPTQVTVAVAPSMVAGNARASTRFFSRFDAAVGTVDHRTFLTPAEKRLIAEWLDIGAQYYNNPFAAPLN